MTNWVYVPLAEVGAEFLFQVIAERAEKTAVIVTTNLPFSEWTQVIPNAQLCQALIDDRANIIETGAESYHSAVPWRNARAKSPYTKSSYRAAAGCPAAGETKDR